MNATVVIPTYNERENLGGLVSAILENPAYNVIVVDDDSPDGTGALALEGLISDGCAFLIERCTSRGKSAAGSARSRSSSWNAVKARQRFRRAYCWNQRSRHGDCA